MVQVYNHIDNLNSQFQGMDEKLNNLTKLIADLADKAKKTKQKTRGKKKTRKNAQCQNITQGGCYK